MVSSNDYNCEECGTYCSFEDNEGWIAGNTYYPSLKKGWCGNCEKFIPKRLKV